MAEGKQALVLEWNRSDLVAYDQHAGAQFRRAPELSGKGLRQACDIVKFNSACELCRVVKIQVSSFYSTNIICGILISIGVER